MAMDEVENLAISTGCSVNKMPFWYLGLPIGSKNGEGGGWRDGKLWLTIFKKYLQIGKLNFSVLATC